MGTMSILAQGAYIAHANNYQKGRGGYKICKFTPHIMAGILTAKQCAVNIFQKPNRYASANYCIGNEGDIVCNVYEENRAYTSSSYLNDCQAITVEVSNCEVGGKWRISDKAWDSLVKLAVDVCKRYKFRLVYDGTPNGSLTRHNMFANTSCPGAYLQSRFQELADTVNAILDGNTQTNTTIATSKVEPNCTGVITYQAYTNGWLPEVHKCDNTDEGFAGIGTQPISGFRCKPEHGEIIYEAHQKGGNWLGAVNSKDYRRNDLRSANSYAGIYGKPIDGIRIKSTRGYVDYRVKTREDGWLPWARGFGDKGNLFAGIYGHAIIGIQMK